MAGERYPCTGRNQGFTQNSNLAGRMEGILLRNRRDFLGAIDLVEGSEEFGLTLNLNHLIDFSYIVRQELET